MWKKLNEILEKLLWLWKAIGFRSQHQVTLDCYSRGGGKGKSQQAQKKRGHLLAKCDVYGRRNFVESDYRIVSRLPDVIIFTSYERHAVGSI